MNVKQIWIFAGLLGVAQGFFLSTPKTAQEGRQSEIVTLPGGDIMVVGDDNTREQYSCFPWVFNPGCYLNSLVDWDWVCRTNTMGWEQCDLKSTNTLPNPQTAQKFGTKMNEEDLIALESDFEDFEEVLDGNLAELLANSAKKSPKDVLKDVDELQKVKFDIEMLNKLLQPIRN